MMKLFRLFANEQFQEDTLSKKLTQTPLLRVFTNNLPVKRHGGAA
jgi:hypothetical protein